jgi:hypothetical protein
MSKTFEPCAHVQIFFDGLIAHFQIPKEATEKAQLRSIHIHSITSTLKWEETPSRAEPDWGGRSDFLERQTGGAHGGARPSGATPTTGRPIGADTGLASAT